MKSIYTVLFVLCLPLVFSLNAFAQATGDYRSNGTGGGNWSVTTTWQRFNGTSWVAALAPPTGSEVITIQSTDSVGINVAASISDTLINRGRLGGGNNLTIAGGGTFQHDRDGGSLPVATWSTGSTLLMTGSTGVSPDNRNQSFYNVTFNTPGLLSNLNMGWDSVTIGGNISVINTSSARWQMTAPAAGDSSIFTIMGDIIVTGGAFSTNGTSNANTKIVVHHYGDIIVTGGNLSVSRGSQGSGTGSTRWYLHDGNFSMTNATTQNSNPTNAWFVFDKAGTQTLTLGSGNTLTALPIEVRAGTTLDVGVSEVRGSGLFTLNAGATLATGNDGGLDSAISVTGNKVLSTGASYTFNGSVAQVTSLSMPATVNNLVINNAGGVTLTQATIINGILRLMAGVFDNTIPFTLGPGGSISYEGGSLLIPVSVDLESTTIPVEFGIEQNYPNPFNPSTTIKFSIPQSSHVLLEVFGLLGQSVSRLVDEQLSPGSYRVAFDASNLPSGIYIYRLQSGSTSLTGKMVLMK